MTQFNKKHSTSALKDNVFNYQSTSFLIDSDCGLYIEDYFNEMIYMERIRAERSARPFLLVLINISALHGEEGICEIQRAVAANIVETTRETDVKGWYRSGSIMGIIFTEIEVSEIDAIRSKLGSSISSTGMFTDSMLNKIRISFHLFPESRGEGESVRIPPDMRLYPESVKKKSYKKRSLMLKRCMDIVGSILALIIFSPLLLIIPLMIKLTSHGPVLFKQTRVGENGVPFTFLKFRSMKNGNDDSIHSEYVKRLILEEKAYDGGLGVYKIKDDPRVTSVGRWLRKTSLDELPQFLNVLAGDMSLVGPRPPIPYELENYHAWHWRRVLDAKPGITGLWQVKGRSLTTFSEMVRLDIRYINNWSVWLDLKLILQTPWSMVTSKGAY